MLSIFEALSSYLLTIRLLVSSDSLMKPVIVSTMLYTFSMLSTSWWFEDSTSFIAVLITEICSPSLPESSLILLTFWPVRVTFSRVTCISLIVCSIEIIILSDISERRVSASCICPEDDLVSVLRVRICSATTANPLPASPALAASIEALRARRLVWLEILSIVLVSSLTVSNSFLNSVRIFSTSFDNSDIVFDVFTRLSRSVELVWAWEPDSAVRDTISLMSPATFSTWELMSVVISSEDEAWFWSCLLLSVSSLRPSSTRSEPCLFSEASSRTTVMPSMIVLLAVFTFSTVVTTRCKSALMLSVNAPSDSLRCLIDIT